MMTTDMQEQTLAAGIRCHDAGDLQGAERHYCEVLRVNPRNAKATYLLGLLAHQVRKVDLAIGLISQAIRLDGRQPTFHARLGESFRVVGRIPEAIECYRQALKLNGRHAEFHNGLGTLLQSQGDLPGAIACYRQATALSGNYFAPWYNQGLAHQQRGEFDEAAHAFGEAVRIEPGHFEATIAWAGMLQAGGHTEQALAQFNKLAVTHPDSPQVECAIGVGHQAMGNHPAAMACYLRAIELAPDFAEAHYNLGTLLQSMGNDAEAARAYQRATELHPRLGPAWSNLANALVGVMLPDEAVEAARKAQELQPRSHSVMGNLAAALQLQGDMLGAIAAYRTAVELHSGDYPNHSNLLYTLNFSPDIEAQSLYEEHLRWARQHAERLTAAAAPHKNERDPQKRLRVGYVSAHFKTHAVAFFLEPLIAGHDRAAVELFCYSDVLQPDEVTARFKTLVDGWRDVSDLSDDEVAAMIRADEVDILVDAAGHIGGNRLLVFARKPAPVQVTYLGYQNTTGMSAMDYRLTDAHADPPGATDRFYTEKLIRLPEAFFVFQPPADAPPVGRLPAERNGFVTFGSLNNIPKLRPQNFRVWGAVLARAPNSRLMVLGYAGGVFERNVREMLAGEGIEGSRVQVVDKRPRREYLELHNEIDLALDSFPFNGHTTVCDALWMGVPSIMLEGEGYASRFGGSTLLGVGLGELIARSEGQYVELAVALAEDRERLGELRRTLRERFAASPLVDARRFASQVEQAYREMWRAWCATGSTASA